MFTLRTIIQAPTVAGAFKGCPAVLTNKTNYDQSRSLCHKSKLQAKKTIRWPYEKIPWTRFTMLADPFTKIKFNENTKLIVVDGNVAAGKEAVAKRLAEEFGLLYLPPNLDLDKLYINQHGYDYRALNPLLPERLRICDYDMFHENPSRLSVIHMQHYIFKLRLFQLFKALRHIFNTGQGVVLTRSAFTDRVFVEAMHNLGWLPKGYLRGDGVRFYDWKLRYNFLRNLILSPLQRPHLVLYVDTPVDVCLDRIKNDPNPSVRNSNALTREFLEEIESVYKDVMLPKCEHSSIVHTISGAKPLIEDDYVDLVDEIEAMDFEIDDNDTHFYPEWDTTVSGFYQYNRRLFTTNRMLELTAPLATTPFFDIAGMGDVVTNGDLGLRASLYEQHVDELGYWYTYDSNRTIQNWFKTYFGWENFEDRIDKEMRLDFS